MKAEGSVLFLGFLVGVVGAHDWGWGDCNTIKAIPSLNVDKFLGLWYVIELFDSSSTCQTLNYTKVSETQLAVTKARELLILDTLSIDHRNSYTGKLDIPNGDDAGNMRVKWPLNLAGKADYIVFDTDYDTYASIYECQQISALAHRQSATILGRKPTLDAALINKVKKSMTAAGISVSHFDKINHSQCIERSDGSLNIDIDDTTLRKIASSAGNGIVSAAETVANGASSFADTVVDATRRLGSSADGVFGGMLGAQKEAEDSEVEIIS